MNLEKLKELLESGAITQEEFDEMAQAIEGKTDPTPDPEPDPTPEPEPTPIDYDKLEKIMQSKIDKALAEERKEKAALKKQLDIERKARLSDDELKKIEMEEKEQEILDREKAIADKENRLYAVKAIKEAGLDDGSDISLSLVDFVLGENETEIDVKVKSFKELFDKAVSNEVDKRLKKGGHVPKKGENLNGGVNPWKSGQENITQQMNIEVTNPELAAQLKAAAGVK